MAKTINKLDLLLKLRDLRIKTVETTYSGSGDSGSIDYITFVNMENENLLREDIGLDVNTYGEFQTLIYSLLEDVEDWYNNDGGFGTVTINVETGEYNIDNNVNIITVETYTHEGTILEENK